MDKQFGIILFVLLVSISILIYYFYLIPYDGYIIVGNNSATRKLVSFSFAIPQNCNISRLLCFDINGKNLFWSAYPKGPDAIADNTTNSAIDIYSPNDENFAISTSGQKTNFLLPQDVYEVVLVVSNKEKFNIANMTFSCTTAQNVFSITAPIFLSQLQGTAFLENDIYFCFYPGIDLANIYINSGPQGSRALYP